MTKDAHLQCSAACTPKQMRLSRSQVFKLGGYRTRHAVNHVTRVLAMGFSRVCGPYHTSTRLLHYGILSLKHGIVLCDENAGPLRQVHCQ
jgi:hypothetical protein